MALIAVALMPLLHLWAIEKLDHAYRTLHRMPPAALALPFAAPVTPNGSPKRSTQADTVTNAANNGPLPGVKAGRVPSAKPIAHDAAAAEMLTTPRSHWTSVELMVSLAGSLLLGGLALAMIFSIARDRRRDIAAAADGTFVEAVRVLAGLTEQTHRDARETVHAMRTPIAVIRGYSELLKRSLPPDNPKALRAVEAINASSIRLVGIVDETWAKALAVADLMQSERELFSLREAVASIVGTSSARAVIRDAEIETSVYGPRAAIEEAIQAVIETFVSETPDPGTSTIRFTAGDGTIGFEIGHTEGELTAVPVDDLDFSGWPRLHEAARTVRLLGGSMAVQATDGRLDRTIVLLPSAPRSE